MTTNGITIDEVNKCAKEWRQGDCVLGAFDFTYTADPRLVLTSELVVDDEFDIDGGPIAMQQKVIGYAIISQTCDIVKEATKAPFVEVAPLISVDDTQLKQIISKKLPRYVAVPVLINRRLVVDLDRSMTIEKPVLLSWQRISGCSSDIERRDFAGALARKKSRAALPDQFNKLLIGFREFCIKKYGKENDEGRALENIREIRVQPCSNWYFEDSHPTTEVIFWFIYDNGSNLEHIESVVEKLMSLIATHANYKMRSNIVRYEEMSALDYITSDHLDYDQLS